MNPITRSPFSLAALALVLTGCALFVLSLGDVSPAGAVGTNARGPQSSKPMAAQATDTPCAQSAGWNVVPAPDAGSYLNSLYGVASVSPNDVWAVGEQYSSGFSSYIALIERWNGSAWSVVQGSPYGLNLRGIAAISANDVWAVGWMGGYGFSPFTEHWDGTQWTYVPSMSGGGRRLYAVSAVSTNDVWAVGQSSTGVLIFHWDGTQWSPSPAPVITNGVLNGVTAVSANDVWAVGTSDNGETVILHWNGSQWSRVASPNSGAFINVLTAVTSTAPDDIWAVGYWATSGVAYHGYVLHYDGATWTAITNPLLPEDPIPAGTYLYGVSAAPDGNVWMVGRNLQSTGTTGVTVRYDGDSWTLYQSPNPGYANTRLYAVTASNPGSIWAVGNFDTSALGYTVPFTERYTTSACPTQVPGSPTNTRTRQPTSAATNTPVRTNTRLATDTPIPCAGRWATVTAPNAGSYMNSLYGVASVSTNDVWAVGEQYSSNLSSYIAIIERWNGSAWSVVQGSPYGLNLRGIAAISANDVWAVGWMGGYGFSPFTEHWDGTQWTYVPSLSSGGRKLYAVSAVSTNDVWAVGQSSTGVLIFHWDGTQWSPSPAPTITNGVLNGVTAVSANDVWAVGTADNGATVILHWDGSAWSRVTSPNTGEFINVLTAVTSTAPDDIWAVGYWATSGVAYHGYVLHYDGSTWTAMVNPTEPEASPATQPDDPTPAGRYLYGVSVAPDGKVWMVGRNLQSTGSTGVTMGYDGDSWTLYQSPNPGYANTRLYAVTASGADTPWAVGNYDTSSYGYTEPLVERYQAVCSTPTPGVPTPTTFRSPIVTSTRTPGVPTATFTPAPTVCIPGNYIITQTTGASIVPGTTDTGTHCSECETTISLPFPYKLYDRIFTSAIVTSKGTLGFIDVTQAYWSDCVPDQYSNYAIFPHWDDLDVSSTCGNGDCGIYTSISGQAPNRIFNIEWRARYHNMWNTLNFEVRLYEGQTRFDLVYGYVTLQGYDAAIGVQKDTGSMYTRFSCWGYVLPEGLQLSFTLSTCNTPTAVATNTRVAATGTPLAPTSTNTPTASAVVPTVTPSACGIQFSDVQPSNPFYAHILCLACDGVMSGYSDGTFRPNAQVTRGQLSKIVSNAAGFGEAVSGQSFEDVQPGSTFYVYVQRMAGRGIIAGYPCGGPNEPCGNGNKPYFRPGGTATRGQISKIIAIAANVPAPTAAEMFEDVPVQADFYNWIEPLGEHGMISGYQCGGPGEPCGPDHRPYFRPANNASRGQIAKIVANTFLEECVARGGR